MTTLTTTQTLFWMHTSIQPVLILQGNKIQMFPFLCKHVQGLFLVHKNMGSITSSVLVVILCTGMLRLAKVQCAKICIYKGEVFVPQPGLMKEKIQFNKNQQLEEWEGIAN